MMDRSWPFGYFEDFNSHSHLLFAEVFFNLGTFVNSFSLNQMLYSFEKNFP